MPLPHVHLITAGGTIAGRLDPSGTVTPGLAASDLLARIPDVASIAHVTAESFLEIPSSLMRFEDMLSLAQRMKQALTDPGVAGVVMMQFLPFADTKALAIYDTFERGVYQLIE